MGKEDLEHACICEVAFLKRSQFLCPNSEQQGFSRRPNATTPDNRGHSDNNCSAR
jgi:hypothetical protein